MFGLLWACLSHPAHAFGVDTDPANGCQDAIQDTYGACVDVHTDIGAVIPGAGAHVGPWVDFVNTFTLAPKATIAGTSTGTTVYSFGDQSSLGRRSSIGFDSSMGSVVNIARAVSIGDRLVAGHNVAVGYGAVVGDDVALLDGARLANLAEVGDFSQVGGRVGRGSQLVAGTAGNPTQVLGEVGPDVTVESGALVEATAKVRRGATVEAGAIVRAGAVVGRGARVGAGAEVESGAVLKAGATLCAGETLLSTETLPRTETLPAGGCPGSVVLFEENFDSGALGPVWGGPGTYLTNWQVIADPTGQRGGYVGAVFPGPGGHLWISDPTSIIGQPTVGPGHTISILFYDDGVGQCCDQTYEEQGLFLYGDNGEIEIRAHGGAPNYLFSIHPVSAPFQDTGIARTVGWHEFAVVITDTASEVYIDGQHIASQTAEVHWYDFGPDARDNVGFAYFDDYRITQP